MDSFSDHYYIQKVLEGDKKSFEYIVKKYSNMVFTLCLRVLSVREEAEEIAQDVFVKVYTSLKNFKGNSKFSTWIYRIAYNTSITKLNYNKRFLNNIDIDNITNLDSGNGDNAFQLMQQDEQKKVINNCILKLTETERIIITLYYFENLPLNEVAEIVGLSLSNVKVKLFRCRKTLYNDLKAYFELEKNESYG